MIKTITSSSNSAIKSIRKLKIKKIRDETGIFYIEGIRLVSEAVRTGQELVHLMYCPELLGSEFGREIILPFENQEDILLEVSQDVFRSFALKDGPQGIAAVLRQRWSSLENVRQKGGIWVALDSIQDPGNLGSILRSCDASGGKGIILLDQSTDAYHPSSARASTGAIFTQEIIKTDFSTFRNWKNQNKIPIIGTYCGNATHYRRFQYPGDMILLMGSEQKGLQINHLNICDHLVTIPMTGSVDSLNISNAASIILFEIFAKKEEK